MDWIAGTLGLIVLRKLGNKTRKCFLLNVVCCLCWISYVIVSGNAFGILIVAVPALVINIRNFVGWCPLNDYIHAPLTAKDLVMR